MDLYNDFAEPLLEEVLSGMAENFFGTRKHLEDTKELFQSFVETLREMETNIAEKAGFLNYLLLDEENIKAFYELLNTDSAYALLKDKFSDKVIPGELPFAFTVKGEFIQFVCRAYNALQKACNEYNNGRDDNYKDEEDAKKVSVNYNLIRNMCDLVNKEVDKVNNYMSPLMVLHCVKKFDPETMEKENITGSLLHGACHNGLDKSLAYEPIDFDSLQLKKYPELPKCTDIADELTVLCKKIYAEKRDEIRDLITDLKSKIQKK